MYETEVLTQQKSENRKKKITNNLVIFSSFTEEIAEMFAELKKYQTLIKNVS